MWYSNRIMKTCNKCHKSKKLNQFDFSSSYAQKRAKWCKACFKKDDQEIDNQFKRHGFNRI